MRLRASKPISSLWWRWSFWGSMRSRGFDWCWTFLWKKNDLSKLNKNSGTNKSTCMSISNSKQAYQQFLIIIIQYNTSNFYKEVYSYKIILEIIQSLSACAFSLALTVSNRKTNNSKYTKEK